MGQRTVTLVNPVDLGAIVTSEGVTNPAFVLPRFSEMTNVLREGRGRRVAKDGPDEPAAMNATTEVTNTAATVSTLWRPRDGTNSKASTERDGAAGEGIRAPAPPGGSSGHERSGISNADGQAGVARVAADLIHDTFRLSAGGISGCAPFILLATVLVGGSGMVWHKFEQAFGPANPVVARE